MDGDVAHSTVGKAAYEDLVRLTFLVGRGLDPADLMKRFLVAMLPRLGATGMWVFSADGLIAAAGGEPPPAPDPRWRGLAVDGPVDGLLTASVLPGMVLVVRAERTDSSRTADLIMLVARMLAMAWRAETAIDPAIAQDDFVSAKRAFRAYWLSRLLARHGGNISAAARASGVSRAALHAMLVRGEAGPHLQPILTPGQTMSQPVAEQGDAGSPVVGD
jgi:hypothetical protein